MVTYARVSTGIVVTGLGVVSPFGTSPEAFRDALLAGRQGMAPVTAFDTSGCRAHCAASVTDFEPTRWIPLLKLRRMDAAGQFAVALAMQTLDSAGVPYGQTPDEDLGIVLGTYTAGGQPTEEFLRGLFAMGPLGAPALIFNATVANIAASLAGLEMKMRGPNATISQKEASGLAAIAHAADIRATPTGRSPAASTPYRGSTAHDRFGRAAARQWRTGSRLDTTRNGFVTGEGGRRCCSKLLTARARGSEHSWPPAGNGGGGASVRVNHRPGLDR